ncbi:MAG: ABC transporter permease [Actinomycetia bacterium]|nr:ABC transporter permease [Actinomycetes bacterium]
MTAARTAATARRVVQQLQHDHRTVALILVVPCVLMGLLAWMLSSADFNQYGAPLLGIFPLIVMFLTTSVATLRERESGTLERLLSMPIAKVDFVFGYALAFGLLGVVQALVVSGLAVGPFGLDVAGPTWALIVVAVVDALLGTALGLFVSAFAKTEFQAVQFMPALILPQLLLCGIVVPRDELPTVLRWVSDLLPMSYAVDAMTEVMTSSAVTAEFWLNVGIVALFMAVGLALGAGTLRRRTP